MFQWLIKLAGTCFRCFHSISCGILNICEGVDIILLPVRVLSKRFAVNDLIFLELNDREREGQYKWADGSKAISKEFRWLPGEPANSPPGEDCVEMLTTTDQFLWSDVPCCEKLSFVCQVGWIFFFTLFCILPHCLYDLLGNSCMTITCKQKQHNCKRMTDF